MRRGKRICGKLRAAAFWCAAALLALEIIRLTLLPLWLEKSLLPGIAKKFGADLSIRARQVGFRGVDFSDVVLRDAEGKTLTIDSLRLDYTLWYPLAIRDVTVSGAEANLAWRDGKLRIDGLALPPAQAKAQTTAAAKSLLPGWLQLERAELKNIRLHVEYAGKIYPVAAKAALRQNKSSDQWDIFPEFSIHQDRISGSFSIKKNGALCSAIFKGTLGKDTLPMLPGKVQFVADGSFDHSLSGNGGLLFLTEIAGIPVSGDVSFSGKMADQTAEASGSVKLGDVGVLVFSGDAAKTAQGFATQFKLDSKDLHYGNMTIPTLTLSGSHEKVKLDTAFAMTLANGKTFAVKSIRGEFAPLAPAVELSQFEFGAPLPLTAHAAATLEAGAVKLNSSAKVDGLPELSVKVTGNIPFGGVPSFALNIPPYRPKEPVDAGKLLPGFDKELKIGGELSAGLTFAWKNKALESGGTVSLRDLAVDFPAAKIAVKGARLNLNFQDIVQVRTAPRQRFSAETVEIGKMKFDKPAVEFQLDTLEQIFVETLESKWCGGAVECKALRLNPKSALQLRADFLCTRINLAQALAEIGVADTTGSGVVSGHIPLVVRRNQLSFENGYLQSDPAEKGELRLKNAQQMLESAGAGGMMSVAQIDLAGEALKNYSYDWVRVNLSTTEKLLSLKLEFDGRPNDPIPFAFDPKSQMLVRSATSTARLQGLHLNLNISLPLNQLLIINDYLKQKGNSK